MSEIEVKSELRAVENELVDKYSKLTKLFFLISLLLTVLVLVIGIGAVVLKYGPNWAGLTLEHWAYLVSIILVFFLILEFSFYKRYIAIMNPKAMIRFNCAFLLILGSCIVSIGLSCTSRAAYIRKNSGIKK